MPGYAFQRFQFLGAVAGIELASVPGRMLVVAVHEFGADAAHLARGARRLDMTQIGEERDRAGKPFGQSLVRAPFAFQLDDIENELPGASSQQSASARGKVTPWRALW